MIKLQLSSMIITPDMPRIDQWLVRCVPRDAALRVTDYAPRTEVVSDAVGPITVKELEERTDSIGFSLDGTYAHAVRAHAGTDHGRKESQVLEFQRHAPVQAVTAAGTILRGRGVYFKLRWSSQQVLEGEKTFCITLQVPPDWRGGLLDVSVLAQSQRRTFGGLGKEIVTLGARQFVVAACPAHDEEATRLASELVAAEDRLRRLAREQAGAKKGDSIAQWWQQLASSFEMVPQERDDDWIEVLMSGDVNPHTDQQIRRLPMQVRVAALDYCDARDAFLSLRPALTEPALAIGRSGS